jgi:hypothetical protein
MDRQFKKIIEKYANRIVSNLIQTYNEMGIRATGDYERDLEVKITSTKLIILGAFHSQFMESGRPAGGRPPISSIIRWIENKKGLPPSMIRDKKRVAFAIANKIAKEGVTVPSQYNKGEVISKVINNFLAKDVYNMVGELGIIWQKEFTSKVDNILKIA